MLMEYALQHNLNRAQVKLLALKSIKKLLCEVDFNAEEIPDDSKRFRQLIESLKGVQLTTLEMEIVDELVDTESMKMTLLKHLS